MNTINLLPQGLLLARRRRRRSAVVVAIAGCVAIGCAAGSLLFLRGAERLREEARAVRVQLAGAEGRQAEYARLQAEREKIGQLLSLCGQVKSPIEPAIILAAIAQACPESIALSRVALEIPPAPPEQAPVAKGGRGAPPRSGQQTAREPALKPTIVDISGFALTDLDAARLAGSLSQHPLFATASLASSRPTDVAGQSRFQFGIRAEIASGREYIVAGEGKELP